MNTTTAAPFVATRPNDLALDEAPAEAPAAPRLRTWFMPVMMEWQWISFAMTAGLAGYLHAPGWPARVASLVVAAWITGLFVYRLHLIGERAVRGPIGPRRWVNDSLAVFFVFWPMLLSLAARRESPALASIAASAGPESARQRIVRALIGARIPRTLALIARFASPACHRRWVAPHDDGKLAAAFDFAVGALLVGGRLGLTVGFVLGFTVLIGAQDLWLGVLGIWYGGLFTSYWALPRRL